MVRQGRMFRCAMQANRRRVTCKVCGCKLEKGKGVRWLRFAPNNDFMFNVNYLCSECDREWGVKVGILANPDPFFWKRIIPRVRDF